MDAPSFFFAWGDSYTQRPQVASLLLFFAMPRTLLVPSHTGVCRGWLKENLGPRDFLCLDPGDATFGFPARAALYRDEKCVAWSFLGSLSAQRSPHVLIDATAKLAALASEDAVVELFPYRPSPLRLQMARLCAQAVQPAEIWIDRRAQLEKTGFPVSLKEADFMEPSPAQALAGHRKARWLQMLDQCEPQEVDLRHVAVDGLRLGSGVPIPIENLERYGFDSPLHAEVAGSSLLIVCDTPVSEVEISRALDGVNASKAYVVASGAYSSLLCAFSRESGDDFGIGRIERIRFPEMVAVAQCTAIPPAPLSTLRVGGLRVDAEGREQGELKPWEA